VKKALAAYLARRSQIFKPGDRAEHNFRNEGVFIGDVHMAGKVDRLEIDPKAKTITIVDYKTGKTYDRWASGAKLHKYRLQLYCYKLLVEGSHTYKDYKVTGGRLEFIEPDAENRINFLELDFKDEEVQRVRGLLQVLWRLVHGLDFPDVSGYDKSLTGIKQFEADLLARK
jgi:hypothetical protein